MLYLQFFFSDNSDYDDSDADRTFALPNVKSCKIKTNYDYYLLLRYYSFN